MRGAVPTFKDAPNERIPTPKTGYATKTHFCHFGSNRFFSNFCILYYSDLARTIQNADHSYTMTNFEDTPEDNGLDYEVLDEQPPPKSARRQYHSV